MQTNPRVAIPAAAEALMRRRLMGFFFSSGSSQCGSRDSLRLRLHCALSDCCSPGWVVLGLAFPCVGVDRTFDQISLADIFVPQLRASRFPATLGQFSIKQIFGDAACFHPPGEELQKQKTAVEFYTK